MAEKLYYWQEVSRGEVPLPLIAESAGIKAITALPGHATVQFYIAKHRPSVCGDETRFQLNTAIDLAMTIALESSLEEDATWAVTEIRVSLLKPIPEGKLLAVGKVASMVDMTATIECAVKDDEGRPIAKATRTYSVYRESQG